MRVGPNLFFISAAAEMLDIHPQTLRKYERLGLIQPSRTVGSLRAGRRQLLAEMRRLTDAVEP